MNSSVSEERACDSCGIATTRNANFCGNCGSKVGSSTRKPNSKWKLRAGLAIGAIAVTVAFAGAWYSELNSTSDAFEPRTEAPKSSATPKSEVTLACYFREDNGFSLGRYIGDGYEELSASPVVLWKLLPAGHPDELCQVERLHPETIYISYNVAFGDDGLVARAISDGYLPGSDEQVGTFESPWYPIYEPGVVTMVVDQPHTHDLIDARLEFELVTIQIKGLDSLDGLSDVFVGD